MLSLPNQAPLLQLTYILYLTYVDHIYILVKDQELIFHLSHFPSPTTDAPPNGIAGLWPRVTLTSLTRTPDPGDCKGQAWSSGARSNAHSWSRGKACFEPDCDGRVGRHMLIIYISWSKTKSWYSIYSIHLYALFVLRSIIYATLSNYKVDHHKEDIH